MEEKEVKFLDIDPAAIEEKLKASGAHKVGEYFYRRQVFDFPGFPLDKQAAWVRLRDEGERITLTFKQRLGISSNDGKTSDRSMKEAEIIVNDYQKTTDFLLSIGMIYKFYEENKRIRWQKGNIEFDIDTWPKLNPYLEIEAPSWEEISEAEKFLRLDSADQKIFSTNQIYKMNGIDELNYAKITFDGFIKREP
jgi:adenylate cyclase class 2